jgi:hypothetical protein
MLSHPQVNLKEQGRLLRQNEFIVSQGKGKKCLRHVFLFEELILFSKARRFPDRKVSVSLTQPLGLLHLISLRVGFLCTKCVCGGLVSPSL